MPYKRIIPIVLIDNGRAVKTINFQDPTYIGDPLNICKIFSTKEVDELCIMNIAKNRFNDGPDFGIVEKISNETFVPLTYAGGVSRLEHFERLFNIGVEKVVINTLFWTNPDLVKRAVEIFGSQSLVLSLDFNFQKKYKFWGKKIFSVKTPDFKGGFIEYNDRSFIDYVETFAFGEVLLTDISREGRFCGLNFDLVNEFSRLSCPIIINGGAASFDELKNMLQEECTCAVAAGSLFCFTGKHRAVLIDYPDFQLLSRGYYE